MRALAISIAGCHRDDFLCDPEKIINWGLNYSTVQKALAGEIRVEALWELDAEVRQIADLFRSLTEGHFIFGPPDVFNLLRFVEELANRNQV